MLTRSLKKPEEGIEYTEKAFVIHISEFTTVLCGYIYYFMVTGNCERGIRATEWAIEHLTRSKEDPSRNSFLDKIMSQLYLMQAILRDSCGQT